MRELSKALHTMRPDRIEAKAEVAGTIIADRLRQHARSFGVIVRPACVVF
jgi:hypothetical protein